MESTTIRHDGCGHRELAAKIDVVLRLARRQGDGNRSCRYGTGRLQTSSFARLQEVSRWASTVHSGMENT